MGNSNQTCNQSSCQSSNKSSNKVTDSASITCNEDVGIGSTAPSDTTCNNRRSRRGR